MADIKFERTSVMVYQYGPPSLTVVSWEFEETVIPLSRYTINIYKGESSTELSLEASGILAEAFSTYEDRNARLLSPDRVYYYQVEAVNLNTGNKLRGKITDHSGEPDVIGDYVVTEHNFLFQQVIGLPCYVYKKQTQGTARCTNCWDDILQRVTKSKCTLCHGTGFVGSGIGGYYNPSYTWIDFSQDIKTQSVNQWGPTKEKQSDLFMSNYPRLSNGDLIIELISGDVWKVFMVRETERRRCPMLQIVRADEMTRDSIEGQILAIVPAHIKDMAKTQVQHRKFVGSR